MKQKEASYCYFSNFNLFEDTKTIVRRDRFVKQLMQTLGEEWRIYAGRSITLTLDGQISYLAWQFCFDSLLFTWLENDQVPQEEFINTAYKKIAPYNVDPIYFKPVCDGFYYSSQQLWVKMRLSRPSSQEFKSVEQIKQEEVKKVDPFFKPLVMVSEKIMSYFKKEPVQQTMAMQIEEPVNEIRQLKQISKLDDQTFPIELIENAYHYVNQYVKKSYANCQVAKTFIVNVVEVFIVTKQQVNQDVLSNFNFHYDIKIRIMQPSAFIYDNLMSLWAIVNINTVPQFIDFVGRAKALLGEYWNENYQTPILTFFETISYVHSQLILDTRIRHEDFISVLISKVKQLLGEKWEEDIVQKAFMSY
ncbi:hypothetical protein pb186bvf_013552 [Paramecium bursaria]